MVWETSRCPESYRLVWAVTVERPRCSGIATARTVPLLTGRNIWLAGVIVAVVAPSGSKPGTGCQPRIAASFPGLPEELMRIGAVIAIVGAHDARNAASRLTMSVSEGSYRARILAWRQRWHDECQRRAGRGATGADPAWYTLVRPVLGRPGRAFRCWSRASLCPLRAA